MARTSPNAYTEGDLRRAMRTSRPGITGRFLLFAGEHHLLPEAYLFGFATAAGSAELRSSYLDGRYSNNGFPDFFFWTLLWKTPLPILIGVAMGLVLALRRRGDRLAFLVIPATLYALYAFSAQINIGHRHLFPILPFVYALCGAAGGWWEARRARRALVGAIAVVWLAMGAMVVLLPRPASVINQHLAYQRAGRRSARRSAAVDGLELRLGAGPEATGAVDRDERHQGADQPRLLRQCRSAQLWYPLL